MTTAGICAGSNPDQRQLRYGDCAYRYWKSRRKRGSDDVYHAKKWDETDEHPAKADWAGLYRRLERVAKWGRADGRHIIGVFEDNNADNPLALMRNTSGRSLRNGTGRASPTNLTLSYSNP
ncbi:hypothetical protein [Paenibacillus larvae]|uniref:hypothetical protein n=1 Tax=Paenibacillus larvae TaxID=1464 RepID=UPI0028923A24|nr:hypothetical protein [Paenibacillus larvae]MDT2193412.1 hypothetical protein [Paenibacillus larvae]